MKKKKDKKETVRVGLGGALEVLLAYRDSIAAPHSVVPPYGPPTRSRSRC